MARLFSTNGYQVIECTAGELMEAYKTSVCICDYCNHKAETQDEIGYYLPVLNQWYCKDCFDGFKKRAVWHPEDKCFEDYQMNKARKYFHLNQE